MSKITVTELSISFIVNGGGVYRDDEEVLIVPVSGSKINAITSEEQLEILTDNLREAFAFLAEEGDVEIETTKVVT